MSIRNFILLILFTAFTVFLMWIFNASIFSACYNPALSAVYIPDIPLDIPIGTLQNCLALSAGVVSVLMLGVPLIVTWLSQIGYTIYMNRSLSYAGYILWFTWIAITYYCAFQLTIFHPPT